MTFKELVEMMAKFMWPVLMGVFVGLYSQVQQNRADMYDLRLHVAESYTTKADLEKMFADFEARIDKRLDQFVQVLKNQ